MQDARCTNENLNNIIYDRNRVLAHWIIICKKNNLIQKISRKRQKSKRRPKKSLWKYVELNLCPPIYFSAERGQELQMNNLGMMLGRRVIQRAWCKNEKANLAILEFHCNRIKKNLYFLQKYEDIVLLKNHPKIIKDKIMLSIQLMHCCQ